MKGLKCFWKHFIPGKINIKLLTVVISVSELGIDG